MLCQKRLYLYVVHYKILILFNQYLREENKCKKLTHSQFVSIQYVCLSVYLSICLFVCLCTSRKPTKSREPAAMPCSTVTTRV